MGRIGQAAVGKSIGSKEIAELIMHSRFSYADHQTDQGAGNKGADADYKYRQSLGISRTD